MRSSSSSVELELLRLAIKQTCSSIQVEPTTVRQVSSWPESGRCSRCDLIAASSVGLVAHIGLRTVPLRASPPQCNADSLQGARVVPTFRGDTPTVRCRELSGADCDRVIPIDAEHCGDPTHIAVHPDPKPIDGPTHISNRTAQARRPTLTVREDFDFFDAEQRFADRDVEADRALPDLSPETFDADHIQVSTNTQKAFANHHRVTAPTAIDEIRLVARKAMLRGKYSRTASGFHRLEVEKFRVSVSPNGRMITYYTTRHFERLPSQVFSGKRSRFGGKRHRLTGGPRLSIDELSQTFDPYTAPVLPRAVKAFATRSSMDRKVADTEVLLRHALSETLVRGEWQPGNREDMYLLVDDIWTWVIASDGVVITLWRHDDHPSPSVNQPVT